MRAAAPSRRRPRPREAPRDVPRGGPGRLGRGSSLGALSGTVAARAQSTGVVMGKAHAGFTPSLTGSKPVVILAIGSGAREGENVMRSLGDSLHLIFLNPAKKRAVLVGVPRDSYMPIPGHGSGKINSSMVYGGPALMVADDGAELRRHDRLLGSHDVLGLHRHDQRGRRPHGRRAVPDGGPILPQRLPAGGAAVHRTRGPLRSPATATAWTRATSAGRRTAAG